MVAGERSGDSHGAQLIQALRVKQPDLETKALGGPLMAEAGAHLHTDLTAFAIIGFTGVVCAYPRLRRIALEAVAYLKQNPPDAVVLIDYPGFNLRLARLVQPLGIPIIYYITPQVWAWNSKRKYAMAKTISLALNILPFEPEIFQEVGLPSEYVGNPLLDQVMIQQDQRQVRTRMGLPLDQPVVGLLPGSRSSEVRRVLPIMLASAALLGRQLPHARFVLITAESVPPELYRFSTPVEVLPISGPAYEARAAMDVALTASGTATLENGLLDLPTVVVYKVSAFNAFMGRRVIQTPMIALPNIIAGREIFPEFLQEQALPGNIAAAAAEFIGDTPRRRETLDGLAQVRARLGPPGAAARAAAAILSFLSENFRSIYGNSAHCRGDS